MLYLGESFDPKMHEHNAVQCCIALKGRLRIRWKEGGEWHSCYSAVIGAGVPHTIGNPDGPLCILYLEKTSNDYRSILEFHGVSADRVEPIVSSIPVAGVLREALLEAMECELEPIQANDMRRSCLRLLGGHISSPVELDPRVSTLLRKLHERPGKVLVGAELAMLIGLSESRMQHLFKAQIGIPIRRYVLWMRLRHVLELALSGSTLTTAAHSAGFSDLAHFTRTFRATFGIRPSALLSTGSGLVPLLCDRE